MTRFNEAKVIAVQALPISILGGREIKNIRRRRTSWHLRVASSFPGSFIEFEPRDGVKCCAALEYSSIGNTKSASLALLVYPEQAPSLAGRLEDCDQ